MEKFIKVNVSRKLTYLQKKSILSLELSQSEDKKVWYVLLGGKWLSCNETYNSEEEATKRFEEVLALLNE